MNAVPETVRALLACPKCRGALVDGATATDGGPTTLICQACRLAYPVERGIPVLLLERAAPVTAK